MTSLVVKKRQKNTKFDEKQKFLTDLILSYLYRKNNKINNNNNKQFPYDLVILISDYSKYVVIFDQSIGNININNLKTKQIIQFYNGIKFKDLLCSECIKLGDSVNISIESEITSNVSLYFGVTDKLLIDKNNQIKDKKMVLLTSNYCSNVTIDEHIRKSKVSLI